MHVFLRNMNVNVLIMIIDEIIVKREREWEKKKK